VATDAGDFVETVDCGQVGRWGVTGGAGGRGRPGLGGGNVGDDLLGSGVEPLDLGGEAVDLAEQNVGELGVVLIEAAGEGLDQGRILDPQPSFGQLREYARVAFSRDQGGQHGPGGDAHDVGGHGGQLDQGVFQQFFDPLDVAGPFAGQVSPESGVVA